MNNPPNPSVATRETDRPPLCCQATSIPLGSATRENLRFTGCETFANGPTFDARLRTLSSWPDAWAATIFRGGAVR
jgi:hypothetical protein